MTPLPSARHLHEVGGVELGLAEERLGTLLVELHDLAEQHAGRGRRQPADALELGLAVVAGEVLQHRAEVVEVDQREPGLVGVVEHQRQRRRLRLVGAEHLGEELRAERRHRRAHGHTRPEAAEREERHRVAARRPLDTELRTRARDLVVRPPRAAAGRRGRPSRRPRTLGTPMAESCSAMSCSVLVLPVPVAPAMSPCRLHMLAGTCTTASATTAPSSIPRPSETASPSVVYACAIRVRTPPDPVVATAGGYRDAKLPAMELDCPTSPWCSSVTARPSGAARVEHTSYTDIALTPLGCDQARAVATRSQGIDFSLVLTSPRQRARMTCAFAGLRVRIGRSRTISPSGTTASTKVARPRRSAPRSRVGRSFSDGAPGGETAGEVAARADRVLERATAAGRRRRARSPHGHFLRVPRCAVDRAARGSRRVARARHRDPLLSSATNVSNASCASGTAE